MTIKQAIESKNCNWIQISQQDTKKVNHKVTAIYVSLDEDKLKIIWQIENNTWEAIRDCTGSLRKLICETIHNPVYRGTSSLQKINGNIITCDLKEIDKSVS